MRSGPKTIPTRNSTIGPMTASSPHLARRATLIDTIVTASTSRSAGHQERLVRPDRQRDGEQLLPAEGDARDQIEQPLHARQNARDRLIGHRERHADGEKADEPGDHQHPRRPAESRTEPGDQPCRAAPRRPRAPGSARSGRSATARRRRSRSPASTAARRGSRSPRFGGPGAARPSPSSARAASRAWHPRARHDLERVVDPGHATAAVLASAMRRSSR